MEIINEFESIKSIVRSLLETDDRTRNSDHWLILETLRKLGFKIYINYEDLKDMPSFETITRCRRKLQEENSNLRADETIEEQRKNRKEEFKEYFSGRSRGIEVPTLIKSNFHSVEIFER